MIGVVLNSRSGFVKRHGVDQVRGMILHAIPDAEIHTLEPDDDLEARCKAFLDAGATCIAAVGGDGTIRSVAAQLVGTDTPLGVIPGGTLNHFARDVGVGRDVEQALQVLARGYSMPVDIASVNDHVFLNNSSLGLYPRMVDLRERYENRIGKWRAMMRATVLALRHAPRLDIDLADGDGRLRVRTHVLFIGNNQYELDLLSLGRRYRLDSGELWCCGTDETHRFRLIPNIFAFLRGSDGNFFRQRTTPQLTVMPHNCPPRVEVSADGEVVWLKAPLVYKVLPRALNVVVPKPPPPESREARDAVPS